MSASRGPPRTGIHDRSAGERGGLLLNDIQRLPPAAGFVDVHCRCRQYGSAKSCDFNAGHPDNRCVTCYLLTEGTTVTAHAIAFYDLGEDCAHAQRSYRGRPIATRISIPPFDAEKALFEVLR